MAITGVGTPTQGSDTDFTNTQTLAKPTGVVNGNTLVAFQYSSNNLGSLLSGFTSQLVASPDAAPAGMLVSSRTAASEPSSYVFAMNSAVNNAMLMAVTGASGVINQASASLSGGAIPSVTVTVPNSRQYLIYSNNNFPAPTVVTPPSGGVGTYSLVALVPNQNFASFVVYARDLGSNTGVIAPPSTSLVWSGGSQVLTATFVMEATASASKISGLFFALLLRSGGSGAVSTRSDIPGPAGAASFSVAWDLPTLAADGGVLATLLYQQVEYGTDGVTFPYIKYILDGVTTTATISGIAAGTYYARIVVSDIAGNSSYPSDSVVKVAS